MLWSMPACCAISHQVPRMCQKCCNVPKAQQGDSYNVVCACTEQLYWVLSLLSHESTSRLNRLKIQSHYAELCEVSCNCCNLTGMTVAIAKTLASADKSSRSLTRCCRCCRSCVTASSCQAVARLWLSLYRPRPTSPVNCWSTCPAAMLLLLNFKPRWAALPMLLIPEA